MTRPDGAARREAPGVEAIQDLIDRLDGTAAVYARRLDTGAEIAVGDVDEPFPTGSAAKLAVLLAFAHGVAGGTVDPATRVTMEPAYRDSRRGSGVLRFLDGGLSPTLHDCAALMMIVSDNVATDLLLDALGGPGPVNDVLRALGGGGDALQVASPTVWLMPPKQFGLASPRGLAEAWTHLATPGPLADLCRSITWWHQAKEGFARHVPFAPDLPDFGLTSKLGLWAKAGSYPSVSCEAGLFETAEASWVLAVMARDLADWGNGSTAAGPTLRAEVSRIVYDLWGGS